MKYNFLKPNAVIHLYETAHSGFYSEDPTTTVNLVPKTWTRYTVTDGDWMTPKTVEPLVLRDIYLANKIDELDEYKNNFYKAGKHIIIDYDTNTISVNPFDYNYKFINGIMNTDYDVTTDLPLLYGGLPNKLILKDDVITYSCESGISATGYIDYDVVSASAAGLTPDSISDFPDGVTFVNVTSAVYEYDNSFSDSGCWMSGYEELYDEYAGKKVRHDYIPVPPPVTAVESTGRFENIFNPADERVFDPEELTGGSNYIVIEGEGMGPRRKTSMVPTGVMFIYYRG